MSWISRRRAWRPSIRYSLSPERKRRRVMVTSLGFEGITVTLLGSGSPSGTGTLAGSAAGRSASIAATGATIGSTRTIVTEAIPTAFRFRVPAKITSSMRAPRKLRADCSPNTQVIASLRFDLPHPFGPTTAAMPLPGNFSSVRSQKDLKPCSSTRFSFSKAASSRSLGGLQPYYARKPEK